MSEPQDLSPPEPKRILFFRQGTFSHINERVAAWLREQFPGRELVQIDVLQEVIKSKRRVMLGGAVTTLSTYAKRLSGGKQDFRDLYYKTPYMFQAVRRLVQERYGHMAATAEFSIQTQSLFDAGIDGLPHFLYTDHTHLANRRYPQFDSSQLASPRWIELERDLYHRVKSNLVMSQFVRQSLIEDYGCDPARIAVVGAAPNLPAPSEAPHNENYSNKKILFVGIDWERKGGPVLLKAFEQVLKRAPDARLVIAGCSPDVRMPNVEIVGRRPLAEVSWLLLQCSVLALPSWREPQGINVIEALMHAIPVVTTDVGALPEAVEDGKCGRIVQPGDADGLASALIEMITHPELCRACGRAARESALARYAPAIISMNMGGAIRAALAG